MLRTSHEEREKRQLTQTTVHLPPIDNLRNLWHLKGKVKYKSILFWQIEIVSLIKRIWLAKGQQIEYKGVGVDGMHMWRGKQQEVEYKHFFLKSCLISVQTNFPETSVFTQGDGMPLYFLLKNRKENPHLHWQMAKD